MCNDCGDSAWLAGWLAGARADADVYEGGCD